MNNAADITDWLLTKISALTGIDPASTPTDAPFQSLGLDSETALSLSGDLAAALGRPVDVTLVYAHPTINALAREIAADEGPRQKIIAESASLREPIAIVGMACRFPGAPDKEAYWALLRDGRDGVTAQGANRWGLSTALDPRTAGIISSGGFVDDIEKFDASLFGILPEEARRMDPQQRMLLESSWLALQDAGIPQTALRGSNCGVFVGISTNEYARRQLVGFDAVGAHTGTGNALAVAANRISYTFDLHGPSLAVDTACSSSLVALHLACESLREGACDMALVGGANVLLEPELSVALTRAGMLAPSLRCRTFDETADGYVRGEGCGMVVLRPLRTAQRAGDTIYAVIKGSAVNQDGQTNGLTAPNPLAQVEVLSSAYAAAGCDASAVAYVEAHGTGTPLGDPIEVDALTRVLCPSHRRTPLAVGAVKSNIGHLESAAGIAGVIKTALAIHHGVVPANLHFHALNSKIQVSSERLRIVDKATALPQSPEDRVCGVSSFGFGGTNAHVVLTGAPPAVRAESAFEERPGPWLIPLSAPTDRSLRQFAYDLKGRLLDSVDVRALAGTLGIHRDQFPARTAIIAQNVEHLRVALDTCVKEGPSKPRRKRHRRALWVFSGQGPQHCKMTRELMKTEPLFASAFRRCDEIVEEIAGWSMEELLQTPECERQLTKTRIAQPCLVAYQIALAALYRGVGLEPAAVVGHSIGEVSAAYVAGALGLRDAMSLAIARGEAMAEQHGRGAMLLVKATAEDLSKLDGVGSGDFEVAALNSKNQVVVAGSREALTPIAASLTSHWLPMEYAFHCSQMAIPRQKLERANVPLAPQPERISIYSTITGARLPGGSMDIAHWALGVQSPVRFEDAIRAALADVDPAIILELGPRPALIAALEENLADGGSDGRVVAGVDARRGERKSWLEGVGAMFEAGFDLRFGVMTPSFGGRQADLPPLTLDRTSHWIPRTRRQGHSDPGLLDAEASVETATGRTWRVRISTDETPLLKDHAVFGRALLPASTQLLLLASAAQHVHGQSIVELENIRFTRPVFLDGASLDLSVHTTETPDELSIALSLADSPAGAGPICSARAIQQDSTQVEGLPGHDEDEHRRRVAPEDVYAALARTGMTYGPGFRTIADCVASPNSASGLIAAPGAISPQSADVMASLIDGGLQLIGAAVLAKDGGARTAPLVPATLERARLSLTPRHALRAVAYVRSADARVSADVSLVGLDGSFAATLTNLRLAELPTNVAAAQTRPGIWTYRPTWIPAGSLASLDERSIDACVVVGHGPEARALRDALQAQHCAVELVDALAPGHANNSSLSTGASWTSLSAFANQHDRCAVAVLPSGADIDARKTARSTSLAVLDAVQGLSWAPFALPPRLYIVSQSGALDPHSPVLSEAAIGFGLARSAHFEAAALACTCIDVGAQDSQIAAATALAAEILSNSAETEVRLIHRDRYVRRLRSAPGPQPGGAAARQEGCHVVLGATGALGRLAVRWLLNAGADEVIALSRTAPSASWWEEVGAGRGQVRHFAVDVDDADAVAKVIEDARTSPLTGVVHAAGVLRDGPLLSMSHDAFDEVMTPKVAGMIALRGLNPPPKWAAIFSSAASDLGAPGQANYAAASAFVDAYSEAWRMTTDVNVVSINWGPWAGDGMAQGSDIAGISGILPTDGFEILEQALQVRWPRTLVLPFDLKLLLQHYPAGSGFSLFSDLLDDDFSALRSVAATPHVARRPALATPFVPASNDLERRIAALWQAALGFDQVGIDDPIFELGGDSVLANQILVEVNRVLGVSVEPEDAFETFTVRQLAILAEARALEIITGLDSAAAEQIIAG